MKRARPPSPKDRIEVTIERRQVWAMTVDGRVGGRPVQGSATVPDLKMVGVIIGGLQKATPSALVKLRWVTPSPRRPRKGGRR